MGAPLKHPVNHITIVLRGLGKFLIGPQLCRETPVSKYMTTNVRFSTRDAQTIIKHIMNPPNKPQYNWKHHEREKLLRVSPCFIPMYEPFFGNFVLNWWVPEGQNIWLQLKTKIYDVITRKISLVIRIYIYVSEDSKQNKNLKDFFFNW